MKIRLTLLTAAFFVVLAGCSREKAEREGASRDAERRAERASVRMSGRTSARAASVRADRKAEKTKPKSRGEPEEESVWTLDDFDDAEHPYSREDKEVALALQLAVDAVDEFAPPAKLARDRKRLVAMVHRAASSRNPALRRAAIDACGSCGSEALGELSPLIADPDAEVAQDALNAIESALDDIEDPRVRFKTAAVFMKAVAHDEDALDAFRFTLISAASECQETVAERREFVATLKDLVEKGPPAVKDAAKEAYGDVSGEEWKSPAEAEKWARDPENYSSSG